MAKPRKQPKAVQNRAPELSERELEETSGGTQPTGSPLDADELFAMFMKLSINDPNNDPENHEALKDLQKKTRAGRP